MKQRMVVLGLGVLLVVQMLATTVAAKEYTVALSPYYPFAPFIIANAKGFFAEAGIQVKPVYYDSVGEWYNAVLYDKVDIPVVWLTTHTDLLFGGKKFIVSGVISYDASYKLVAKADLPPEQWRGLNVGMTGDFFYARWMLLEYLTSQHLTLADVKIVSMTEEELLQNFLAGRLKVVFLPGNVVDQAVKEGKGVVLATTTQQQTLEAIAMTEQTYQAIAKEDLPKLYRGLLKALIWLNDPANDAEQIAILQKQFAGNPIFSDVTTLDALKKMRVMLPILKPEELAAANTTVLQDAYARMKAVRTEMGLPADFDYNSIMNTSVFLDVLKAQGLGPKP